MFLIIIQNIASSLTVISAKQLLQYVTPLFYMGIRLTLAGIILLGCQYIFRYQKFGVKRSHIKLFGQVIVIRVFLAYALDAFALENFSAARACVLYNLAPLFAVLFSYLFFSEVMTFKKWVGLGIGFLGMIPLMAVGKSSVTINVDGVEQASDTFLSWSGLMLFGAVVANTYGYIVMRDLIKNKGYSTMMVTGIGLIGGGLLAFFSSLIFEGWNTIPKGNAPTFIGHLLLVILLGNVIALNLYSLLLKRYTVSFLSFAGFLYTAFGALFGWLFLNEAITINFFISFILIIIGLYIFYQQERKQGYIQS